MFILQMFHVLLKPNWNIPIKSKHKVKPVVEESYIKVQDTETEMDFQ